MPEETTLTARTLVELLRQQADRHGDKVAFSFCPDGDDEEDRLTYRDLDIKARAIAANLQRQGAEGKQVLVICRPGLDGIAGIFGCFYAGAVAVPVDEHWASRRIAVIVPDARANFALATTKSQAKLRAEIDGLVDGTPLQWHDMDRPVDESAGDAENWTMPDLDPDATTLVQYTSGTTGAPKGVMLSHRNLLFDLEVGSRAWMGTQQPDHHVYTSPVTGVSWLPHYQQMGLVGVVIGSLYIGGTTVLMAPGSFLMRPMRWLQAISRHRAVISVAPNFAYDWCVKRSTEEERAALDLSHWSVAAIGGEPVRAETLRAFAEAFAPAGFRPEAFIPVYGLAEVTLGLSGVSESAVPVVRHIDRTALGENRVVEAAPDDPGAAAVVGCGRPRGADEVVIVDPETRQRRADSEVGEVWVSGPSVARGYWGKPDETEQTFNAHLAGGEGPYLRTGDLGFFHHGELFITGRCRDLITLGGYSYYPNDIEMTVQDSHPALLPGRGAVFTVIDKSTKADRLVVVQEVQRHRGGDAEPADIIAAIRAAITAHHGVDADAVVLVKPMRVATTPTGKIQRGECRQQFLDGELDVVAEWQAPPPPVDTAANAAKVVAAFKLARLAAQRLARHNRDNSPPKD